MELAAALAKKKFLEKKQAKAGDDDAFADAAREVFELAKKDDVGGFADALRGAIDIALLDKGDDG